MIIMAIILIGHPNLKYIVIHNNTYKDLKNHKIRICKGHNSHSYFLKYKKYLNFR